MTWRLGALAGSILAVTVVALLVTQCGGDDNGGDPGSNRTPNNGATGVATPADDGTPLPFEQQRDNLADSLDAIGSNTGAVPPDVRQELLIACGDLADLADRETVQQLCNAINQAFLNDDPDLMDLVVREMRKLEAR